MARTWQLLETLPGGHRLFRSPGSSSIYIADESGRTPDLTDDGPLWLDQTMPLTVEFEKHAGNQCHVPVIGDATSTYRVPVSVADVLWLSDRYGWAIETTGASRFRAVRVTA